MASRAIPLCRRGTASEDIAAAAGAFEHKLNDYRETAASTAR